MSDQFGLLDGAKGFSEGIKTGKTAGKEIGKSIEDVQKEATDVAVKKALERKRQQKEAEFLKERAIFKALDEYRRRKRISDEEYRAKVEFVKKYGTKEWDQVLRIKTEIEKLEKQDAEHFKKDLAEVRRVMYICYALAAVIAYYVTWGNKG